MPDYETEIRLLAIERRLTDLEQAPAERLRRRREISAALDAARARARIEFLEEARQTYDAPLPVSRPAGMRAAIAAALRRLAECLHPAVKITQQINLRPEGRAGSRSAGGAPNANGSAAE